MEIPAEMLLKSYFLAVLLVLSWKHSNQLKLSECADFFLRSLCPFCFTEFILILEEFVLHWFINAGILRLVMFLNFHSTFVPLVSTDNRVCLNVMDNW